MTFASVPSYGVVTYAAIATGLRLTIIDIDLAPGTSEAHSAGTFETVDHIMTNSTIQTGVRLTFININFTLCSGKSGHTDTTECAGIIQTAAFILTRM